MFLLHAFFGILPTGPARFFSFDLPRGLEKRLVPFVRGHHFVLIFLPFVLGRSLNLLLGPYTATTSVLCGRGFRGGQVLYRYTGGGP